MASETTPAAQAPANAGGAAQADAVQIESAQRLLAYLRTQPDPETVPDLAERFGLSTEFVQSVLETATRPSIANETVISPRLSFGGLRRVVGAVRRAISAGFSRPIPFVVATSFAGILALTATEQLVPGSAKLGSAPLETILSPVIALSVVMLHFACYFRSTRLRYPVQGGILAWAIASIALIVITAIGLQNQPDSRQVNDIGLYLAIPFAMGFLAVGYTGAGIVAALIGGWYRARGNERREELLSRQELLERYFELESRLQKGSPRQRLVGWFEDSIPAKVFRAHPLLTTAATFAVISLASNLVSLASQSPEPAAPSSSLTFNASNLAQFVLGFGLLFSRVLAFILIGLFSRSIGVAMLLGLLGAGVDYFFDWIPIGRYNFASATRPVSLILGGLSMVIAVLIAGFSGLAAELQRRALRQSSLDNNDPATLLAEMLRIQWRLADQTQEICVMAIDAAKSAQMKANMDPLRVEYSFREYQDWIRGHVQTFGGEVHSTAGDGAIVAFSDCEKALRAARRLQTDLDRFNREVNELEMPFRLRIGLHAGTVVGRLDDVQFTEVIDIAAHIQGAATVGGIAVTESIVARSEPDDYLPLAKEIDGHRVYLVLNPTED